MRYHRAGIGERIDALDRAGDPDLLSHQLVEARLEAAVPDRNGAVTIRIPRHEPQHR